MPPTSPPFKGTISTTIDSTAPGQRQKVQEYGVCIKEVTMTSGFSIDNSQKIRKLLKNEALMAPMLNCMLRFSEVGCIIRGIYTIFRSSI